MATKKKAKGTEAKAVAETMSVLTGAIHGDTTEAMILALACYDAQLAITHIDDIGTIGDRDGNAFTVAEFAHQQPIELLTMLAMTTWCELLNAFRTKLGVPVKNDYTITPEMLLDLCVWFVSCPMVQWCERWPLTLQDMQAAHGQKFA